jgi:hypothetical protein
MSKFVLVIERNFAGLWEPYAVFTSRHDACEVKSCILETRIVKYIPAPVAPKAPKPAPKPVAVFTDWISCKTPPVRIGVYLRRSLSGKEFFQAWNGEFWNCASTTAEDARRAMLKQPRFKSLMTAGDYRGFTTPQE